MAGIKPKIVIKARVHKKDGSIEDKGIIAHDPTISDEILKELED